MCGGGKSNNLPMTPLPLKKVPDSAIADRGDTSASDPSQPRRLGSTVGSGSAPSTLGGETAATSAVLGG